MTRKVSDILDELHFPMQRDGLMVKFSYKETDSQGRYVNRRANVPDVATVPVTDNGEFLTEGSIYGCHIGIKKCVPLHDILMARKVPDDLLYAEVMYCVKAVLIKLLVECMEAADTLKCCIEEGSDGNVYISAGVKIRDYESYI